MNVEFYEKQLSDLIRSNKERKLKLAIRAVYKTTEEYKASLEEMISGSTDTEDVSEKVDKRPIIHNVTLSDASGSMSSWGSAHGKYDKTIDGVKLEVKELKSNKDVIILHSLYEFVDDRTGVIKQYKDVENPTPEFYGAKGRNTPLWESVIKVLEIFKDVPKSEKVLLKVYTDGGNNRGDEFKYKCKDLIKELNEENFTITFVATKSDMGSIIRALNLDETNTLEIENNAEGFKQAFTESLGSTISYSKKVVRGEDVSKGFYKVTGKL